MALYLRKPGLLTQSQEFLKVRILFVFTQKIYFLESIRKSVICILETLDLYSGSTRSVFFFTRQRLDGPYKSGVAEWCPFFTFLKQVTFYENIRFCMILDGPYKSGVAEWCPCIYLSQKALHF